MTREQAIDIARRCAAAKPQSYYAEPFQPHEWVIDAIRFAGGEGRLEQKLVDIDRRDRLIRWLVVSTLLVWVIALIARLLVD